MLWILHQVDASFQEEFVSAGIPNQEVIATYLAKSKRPQTPQKHEGVKRWYYLRRENPRILLITVSMPLEEWRDGAKIIVGTSEILGEFEGNKEFRGRTGLRLQLQPLAWLQGKAEKEFFTGHSLLAEISEQVLDRKEIDRSQRERRQKYYHHWGPDIFTPIRTNLSKAEAKRGSICDDVRKRNLISRAEGAQTWQM